MVAVTRGEREQIAYEAGVWAVSDGWHQRFLHVFTCPNSERHTREIQNWITTGARGKSALDVGCGRGEIATKVSDAGAAHVLGIDISEHEIAFAEPRAGLEFRLGSVEESIDGKFDVIYGFSILHHLDYRPMLERMYRENLNDGGVIAFQEPLGSSLLTRGYKWRVRNAHTPDEKSFTKDDLRWFRKTFPHVKIAPFGYTSYLCGVPSTWLSKNPNNALMRLCDRMDAVLARIPWLAHRFRRCNIYIAKPGMVGAVRMFP